MIPLMAAGAALGGFNTLYKLGSGIVQSIKGGRIKPQRPTYQIPSEITANQKMAQDLANTSRLPGQSIAEGNIRASSANALSNVKNTSSNVNDVLAAASNINANQNSAMNNLAMEGAGFQMANKDRLSAANQAMAQYKDQAFNYNQNEPYLMQQQRKNALIQSGAQNISGALGDTSNAFLYASGAGLGQGQQSQGGVNPFQAAMGAGNISGQSSNRQAMNRFNKGLRQGLGGFKGPSGRNY